MSVAVVHTVRLTEEQSVQWRESNGYRVYYFEQANREAKSARCSHFCVELHDGTRILEARVR